MPRVDGVAELSGLAREGGTCRRGSGCRESARPLAGAGSWDRNAPNAVTTTVSGKYGGIQPN